MNIRTARAAELPLLQTLELEAGVRFRDIGMTDVAELIDHVDAWASGQGIPALTLSTFRSVPWNGPYYARLGFAEVPAGELTTGLVAILAEETASGLDPAERIFMRRSVAAQ